jgi:hypothetical protein
MVPVLPVDIVRILECRSTGTADSTIIVLHCCHVVAMACVSCVFLAEGTVVSCSSVPGTCTSCSIRPITKRQTS